MSSDKEQKPKKVKTSKKKSNEQLKAEQQRAKEAKQVKLAAKIQRQQLKHKKQKKKPIGPDTLRQWLNYSKYGSVVEHTPLVPFKAPLVSDKRTKLEIPKTDEFTIDELFAAHPTIGLIIDLTDAKRTYNLDHLKTKYNADYFNLPIKSVDGRPDTKLVKSFLDKCKDYADTNPDKLIGVHCLFGIRQAAYMICRCLQHECNIFPDDAIKLFEAARGHHIHRKTGYQIAPTTYAPPDTATNDGSQDGVDVEKDEEEKVPQTDSNYKKPMANGGEHEESDYSRAKFSYGHKEKPYNSGEYKNQGESWKRTNGSGEYSQNGYTNGNERSEYDQRQYDNSYHKDSSKAFSSSISGNGLNKKIKFS